MYGFFTFYGYQESRGYELNLFIKEKLINILFKNVINERNIRHTNRYKN